MRSSDHSPSIVPPGNDQDVYLVLDEFGGRIGQSWREADVVTSQKTSPTSYAGVVRSRLAICRPR